MDEKQTAKERKIEWSGASQSLESPRQLQLTALLNDVMNELGQVNAAQKLGVDRKTLWRCRKRGRLTPLLSAALERLLVERDLSAAMRQGKRVTELEREVTGLHGELRTTREDAEGRSDGLREEHTRGMRHVERRLVALESGRTGAETPPPTAPGPVSDRKYIPRRKYPQLVTRDAEEDEEKVYGDATAVIVQWRKARAEYKEAARTGAELSKVEAQMRTLRLEVALIGKHELTIPPASYPWNREGRLRELRERNNDLNRLEVERNRALLRRWLRRIFTFGLWRD